MRLPWLRSAPAARGAGAGPSSGTCTAPSSPAPPHSASGSQSSPSARWARLSVDSTVDIPPDTPLLHADPTYRDKDVYCDDDEPSPRGVSPSRTPDASRSSRSRRLPPHTALDLHQPLLTTPSSPRTYATTLRAHRRKHRLASLAYSSAVLCLATSLLFAAAVLGWVGYFVYTRRVSLATAIFAPPMQPQPVAVEWGAPPFASSEANSQLPAAGEIGAHVGARVDTIRDQLDARYVELGLATTRQDLTCESVVDSPALLRRYAGLQPPHGSTNSNLSWSSEGGRTFLALNLYNSEAVIPALSHALLTVAAFLDPAHVHVSIFENGSTDRTVAALAHLARALSALGVDHDIVSDPRHTDWKKVDRIDQLAVYRNVALAPLTRSAATSAGNGTAGFRDVVFINDVFACPGDVLELLFQRRIQSADAACAMDWRANKGLGRWWRDSVVYYDSWVGRTLSGQMVRPRIHLLQEWHDGVDALFNNVADEASKERFRRGLPTPVYSCWNGMLALDALPFLSTAPAPRYDPASSVPAAQRKSWRRLPPARVTEPAQFRSALHREGECAASECKTLAKDFWTRGYDRWLVVPSVRVTYDAAVYHHPRLQQLAALQPPSRSNLTLPLGIAGSLDFDLDAGRVTQADSEEEEPSELIPWASLTPPESVVCWAWVRGFHLDFEWVRGTWYRPYAFAQSLVNGGSRGARFT